MLPSNTDKDEETVAFAKKEHSTSTAPDVENDFMFRFNDNVNDIVDNHQQLLSRTDRYFSFIFYSVVSFAFTYAARTNLIVLYARSMKNDTALISVFLYFSYFCSGIASLSFGIIGNKWRFDALLLIAAGMDIITFGLEATTYDFYVLMICYAVGGQPFQTISQAWNLKMLPTYYAKLNRASIVQCCAFAVIFGSVIGGVLGYTISYRATFYASFIVAIILFCFAAVFIFNKEQSLLDEQIKMTNYYRNADDGDIAGDISAGGGQDVILNNNENDTGTDPDATGLGEDYNDNNNNDNNSNVNEISLATVKQHKRENSKFNWIVSNDFRFPNCLIEMQQEKLAHQLQQQQNIPALKPISDTSTTQMKNIVEVPVSKYSIFLIGCFTITSGLLIAMEAVIQVYFAAYMYDVYNINTAWSTSGCAVFSISLMIGMQIIKKKIRNDARSKNIYTNDHDDNSDNYNNSNSNPNGNKYGLSNKYVKIIILNSIILSVINLGVFPLIELIASDMYGSANVYSGNLANTQIAVIMIMYWFVFIVNGICFGMAYITSEAITVDLMPKHLASIISGIKGMTRMCSKGFFCLVVGLLWNTSHDYIWYVQGIQCSTALIMIVLVGCFESSGMFAY